MLKFLIRYLTLQLLVRSADTWHAFSNLNYHCWKYSASASDPTPLAECKGIKITWMVEPPSQIKAQEHFNTTYELLVEPSFYPWAVAQGYFDSANVTGISNSTLAQAWCENVVCPSPKSATPENCCVHHVNVHSCPLEETDTVQNGLCGPWIPPSGSVFTHSEVMVGNVGQGNWTSTVAGLYAVGQTSVIAHFKLAKMHVAIEKTVDVLPRTVCGDSRCEPLEGEDCSNCPIDCGSCPLTDWEITLIAMVVVVVIIIFLAVICVCVLIILHSVKQRSIERNSINLGIDKYQNQRLLWDESWIVKYEDVNEDNDLRGAFGSMLSVASGSENSANKGTMATAAIRRQVFATTALYDGRTVAVKKIDKTVFSLSKAVRLEVKIVREIEHPNLCRFIGGCVDVPNVCILSEYCPKGSLNDVLLNDDIPLNWSFRFSFAADIARGSSHLHSHGVVHGRLTSSNCVVDDRWTVKITDYGLRLFRQEDITTDERKEEYHNKEKRRNIYIAPELRQTSNSKGTMAGDVYSLSIILVEIAIRNDPYCDEDPSTLPEDWKPALKNLEHQDQDETCPCPFDYCTLIKSCWNDKDTERPSMDSVKRTLHKINPTKLSPVDLMMNMMEKYSKHLESIVVERTQDLLVEKQKTDRLLYSMLPRAAADQLRQGRSVDAESFEACTIYFSDIVGFTTLSGGSTPIQIIALLNKLYTTFDEIIEKFDVYKVETIGDAYMVVSGVPERTEIHALEISNMALEIVDACKKFIIPHRPEEALQIRVGLHSGPVCSGVVGLKMPRYCLFGDTVNTASRMESNGVAYRVHISSSTHKYLDEAGGYIFEKRGAIPIKGKGDMTTWWLESRIETGKNKGTGSTPSLKKSSSLETPIIAELEGISRQESSDSIPDSGYNEKSR